MISQLYWDMGERIRIKREQHSLTQVQLAEKLGVNSKHISEVERGNDRLSYDKLILLCDLFDCSSDYLLRGRNTLADGLEIPESVMEVFRHPNSHQFQVMQEFLHLYSKMLNSPKE